MVRILLTHSPDALENYYGPRALAGLRALAEVRLHTGAEPLAGDALLDAAADCDLIVSYRQSPGPATLFARLPRLVAFVRCAIDTRNIDLAAASDAGVLVTQASAGFVASASEMVIGFMVDLARGITRSTLAYRSGQTPAALMGRQRRGSTLGIIGYGAIGREVARLGVALGMRVLVHDPYVADLHEVADIEPVTLDDLLGAADFVVPLAVATAETENLMDASAFATMKRGACFINVSRGNLVDEPGDNAVPDLTMQHALTCVRQIQPFARTRHSNVHQPSFFLHPVKIV